MTKGIRNEEEIKFEKEEIIRRNLRIKIIRVKESIHTAD